MSSVDDDEEPLVFRIGSEDSDHIAIAVRSRAEHWSDDVYGNRLCARVAVRAGALGGTFEVNILAHDLDDHRAKLARLHATLNGTETLDTLEHYYAIEIHGDGRGHFRASCRVTEDAGRTAELRFDLDFDQTEIPEMIAQLDALRAAYPVRGRP